MAAKSSRLTDVPEDTRGAAAGGEPMPAHVPSAGTVPPAPPGVVVLGQLVAETAHELRNPLASILANLEAWEAEPEATFETYGLRIRRETKRMAGLVGDMLELARPPRPSHAIRPALLLSETVDACDLAARVAGVALEREDGAKGAQIAGDLLGLQRALMNVVENAIHHSPRGGIVRIRASTEQGELHVTVEDQGSGFGTDGLRRAFEPFYSRRKGGSGLGLAIAQKVVADHGGRIEASDRSEGGALVCITLPLTQFDGPKS